MKKLFIILLLLFLFPSYIFSMDIIPRLGGQRRGTTSAQFLKIGIGAKASGMGDAFVAIADDGSALYWNPAAISVLPNNILTATHTLYLASVEYDYIGTIYHIADNHTIGISSGVLHMADMEITDELHPHGTGEYFSVSDMFIGLTYATSFTDKFSFGTTLKYVQENLAELRTKSGVADFGMFYDTGFHTLKIGMSVINFGPSMKPAGEYTYTDKQGQTITKGYTSFAPPTVFRVGAGYNPIQWNSAKLLTAIELNHPSDSQENLSLGSELLVSKILALRVGYKINKEEEGLTAGFGLGLPSSITFVKKFQLDYSYADFGRLGYIQRVSMDFGF